MIRLGGIVIALILLAVELYLWFEGHLAIFFTIAALFFLAIALPALPSRARTVLLIWAGAEGSLALSHFGVPLVGLAALPLAFAGLTLSIIDLIHRRRRPPKIPLTDLRNT